MKKQLILQLLFFFVVSSGVAQENSMLWKITGNGLKQESYLFGTVHMLCPDDFEIKQKCLDALDKSQEVVFEVDLSNPDNAQKLRAYSAPDTAFIKTFSDREVQKMDSVLTAEDLSIKLLDYVSPVAVVSLFTMKGLNCTDPTKMKSYEMELSAIATAKGKVIGELETIDMQFALLKDIITPKLFMESVYQLNKYPALTAKMVAAYKTENLGALTALIQDPTWMTDEQKEKLLNERNENWTAIIPKMIKDQSCFIAVGAGHLAGDKGLITLLRKIGYTVTAVE